MLNTAWKTPATLSKIFSDIKDDKERMEIAKVYYMEGGRRKQTYCAVATALATVVSADKYIVLMLILSSYSLPFTVASVDHSTELEDLGYRPKSMGRHFRSYCFSISFLPPEMICLVVVLSRRSQHTLNVFVCCMYSYCCILKMLQICFFCWELGTFIALTSLKYAGVSVHNDVKLH